MGDKCNESCPDHCEYCDQNGYKCKICVNKWYDVKCELECPPNCGGNGSCHIETGICNVCPAGYFGKSCTQKCSKLCGSTNICDQITGQCQNCKAGRYGRDCLKLCSTRCVNSTCFTNQSCVYGCENGYVGEQCEIKCSAVVLNCDQCDLVDNVPICRHCDDQWYLNGTNCFQCPVNCFSCLSDVECLECKKGFYYGKTCNLACNTACINKTCDITGNCKHGCSNSKYGMECDKECLKHCKTCLNSTMCLECKDGYFGESCQTCPKNCTKCKNNSTCTHCKIGWTNDTGRCVECLKHIHRNGCPDVTNTNDAGRSSILRDSIVAIILVIVVFSVAFGLIVRKKS